MTHSGFVRDRICVAKTPFEVPWGDGGSPGKVPTSIFPDGRSDLRDVLLFPISYEKPCISKFYFHIRCVFKEKCSYHKTPRNVLKNGGTPGVWKGC